MPWERHEAQTLLSADSMDLALAPSRRFGAESRLRGVGPSVRVGTSILLWMALAIIVVAALAFWDESRESNAALDDFAREQTTLALAIGSALRDEIVETPTRPEHLLSPAHAIERPGSVRVFLAAPNGIALSDSRGAAVRSKPLEDFLSSGTSAVRLSRADAAELGLPARMAVAGRSRIETPAGPWSVVVVATARVERDREVRARWRLVLGVVLAAGLVLAFGGLALRKQRQELELAHKLALSTLETERNERLVRADKLATMGALATGIAHEVSTPLGVILGRAEQLLPKQSDDRSRRAVETIAAQSERIHAVVRGFLALARGSQPTLEHCSPERLAHAAIELVTHRFEKADVRLESDIAPGLPRVACDPRLFEQVLVNLLLNACDACRAGGLVTLSVRADHEKVAFVVTDDGVGISSDVVDRATEPFFTTKPEGEGTGLGLAIANEIVKHHCGTLALKPGTNGVGTRATVELPVAHSDVSMGSSRSDQPASAGHG